MEKKEKTAVAVGGGLLLLALLTSGAAPGAGTKKLASWIPEGDYSDADYRALLTYPENPTFGKYILVRDTTGVQQDSVIYSYALVSYLAPNGDWAVKNYPYISAFRA
ncbi:MAG: hypothetical protein PHN44_01150 [Candidatus Marinimicrobia bacterium]|nr:hypothetical protein [Candidatus Neomarinimicrobiota bacterium]